VESKLKVLGTLAAGTLLAGTCVAFAQSRVESVLRAEDQRAAAMRAGQSIARFYDPAYRGITALGQYETAEQIRALAARPGYALSDVVVEVRDDTAIVTAIEGSSDAEVELALRIWRKYGDTWTIAAAQTTWIGNRPNAPPPSGPLTNTVEPFTPASGQDESIWRSQQALMAAFSNADPESYKAYSTGKSLRMTTAGESITRDTWLNTIARRQKGPLAVVDEAKIAVYGAVAVVTLRGHEANPTRQSWVYLREGDTWKLHLRFTSLIRN
jgi:Domain of unknown function (DUF4440)